MVITNDDPRFEKIGFAKLCGPDIDLYVKKYEIVLGRKSKSTALDVVLGDNMNISRQHAKIVYNFNLKAWEIVALGKNGVDVNGSMVMPDNGPHILSSQDHITIADRTFYFLLPKTSPNTKASACPKRRQSSKQAAAGGAQTPARGKRKKVEAVVPPPQPTIKDEPGVDYSPNYSRRALTSKHAANVKIERHVPLQNITKSEHYASDEEQHQDYDDPFEDDQEPDHLPGRSFDDDMDHEDDGYQDVIEHEHKHQYNGHAQRGYEEQSDVDEDEENAGYEYGGNYT